MRNQIPRTAKCIGENLYRLSKPVRGFRLCQNGKAAHAPVTYLLSFGGELVESNRDGEICAFGSWPKSGGPGGAVEAFKRIGYDVE